MKTLHRALLRLQAHRWAIVDADGTVLATYQTAVEAAAARDRTGYRRAVRDGRYWMIFD